MSFSDGVRRCTVPWRTSPRSAHWSLTVQERETPQRQTRDHRAQLPDHARVSEGLAANTRARAHAKNAKPTVSSRGAHALGERLGQTARRSDAAKGPVLR